MIGDKIFLNLENKIFATIFKRATMNLKSKITTKKAILGILATIILGAIGSGLWEIALSPLFKLIVNSVVDFFSSISISFENSIYTKVGDGNKDVFVHLFFNIIYPIFIVFPMIYLQREYKHLLKLAPKIPEAKSSEIIRHEDNSKHEEHNKIEDRRISYVKRYKRLKLIFYFMLAPTLIASSGLILLSVIKNTYTHNKITLLSHFRLLSLF